MNPIKELWHGNIVPQEDGVFSKPHLRELLGYFGNYEINKS